jgi:hypothetical protein
MNKPLPLQGIRVAEFIPKVCEHTRDVLSGLGYAAAAIERMATDKVINIG